MDYQYAVIGGGIMGMLTAKYLAQSCASVLVLERSEFGCESSWAGGGIVSPLYPWRYSQAISALAHRSQDMYLSLCHQLTGATGIDPEYQPSGLAIGAIEDWNTALNWASAQERPFSFLHGELDQCVPQGDDKWLYFPHIAQVRTSRLMKALHTYLSNLNNVHLLTNQRVAQVIPSHSGCHLLSTSGSFHCEKAVVCAGAWTSQLLPQADIKPVKGQMILFEAFEHNLKKIVLVGGHYLIPRKDGHILVGSSLEHQGFANQPDPLWKQRLQAFACTLMPVLKTKKVIRQWSGLRPGREQLPLISAVDETNNLFVNAGHFRNGVVLAPASARLAADLMLSKTPALDPKPYQLSFEVELFQTVTHGPKANA